MSETITITRDEANEKIAGWFEPKPPIPNKNNPAYANYCVSSDRRYWSLVHKKWQWEPRYDYCGDMTAAHKLAVHLGERDDDSLEVYVTFAFDGLGAGFCNQFARPDAAKLVTAAFLYATTGTRYEITD